MRAPDLEHLDPELHRSVLRAWDALDREPWEIPRPSLRQQIRELLGERVASLLALRAAQSVLPMWDALHPSDERAGVLVEDIAGALEGAAPEAHLVRDRLHLEASIAAPCFTVRRALVLAHDLAHRSGLSEETCDLEELCAWAWVDAAPELVPSARSFEKMARAEAFFRWWLSEVVPEAARARR